MVTQVSHGYLDFDLSIAPRDQDGYVVSAHSPHGDAAEPLGQDRLRAVHLALEDGRGTMAASPATARTIGEALFAALFTGSVGDLYARLRSTAADQGSGLRLRLDVEPPGLAVLPWEFLYDPRRGEHVALSAATPLVRSLIAGVDPAGTLDVPAPLRVLGMIADPSDLDRLRSRHEQELVEEALAGLQARGLVELRWLVQGTWRDLQRMMRLGPWHIFHFVGHGRFDPFRNEGYVMLPGAGGAAAPLRASELARLLADSGSLQLALLNSCEGARGSEQHPFSGTAATLVRRGLPAVVAMQDAVGDRAAIEFGRGFYEAVADGVPIDAAVAEARKSVSLAIPGTSEWATPVLYADSHATVLFRIAAEDWAAGSGPGTLPAPQTPLVGRLREVAAIGDLLRGSRSRLITLTGPGGIGKTRLAIECARRVASAFPDGVDLIELAALSDGELVAPEVMRVLGIDDSGAAPLDVLRDALGDQRRLLVLDNCEHLPEVGAFVAALLASCPRLKVLATSRSPLRVRGDQDFRIGPLQVPSPRKLPPLDTLARVEAVALFVERASAARGSFALTDANAAAVAGICARLDGLPLAIELAAARVRTFPPDVLLGELDRRFELLTGGASDLFPHQQALETTIAWSYDLLPPPDQALFRRLAVFAGGVSLEAASAVASSAGGVTPRVPVGLVTLVDHSLLRLEDDPTRDARWTMLESLRAFGCDRLDEVAEAAPTRAAHAAFFLALTRDAAPQLNGPEQHTWINRLTVDHDNLRAGLDWALATGDAETAIGMVTTLWRFWSAQGHLYEGRRRVEAIIDRFDGRTEALDTRLFVAAGTLASAHGDYAAASRWFDRGLDRARTVGDRATEATLLYNSGNVALSRGDHRRAATLFEASLAIFRELGDRRREMLTLAGLGAVAHYLGDVAKAEESYEAVLAITDETGDRRRAAAMLANLTLLLAPLPDRRERARAFGERCLAESRALAWPRGIAAGLSGLGFVAEGEGDLALAAARFDESAQLSRDAEDRIGAATALGNLARVVADQGDPGRALGLAMESFHEFQLFGDESAVATTIELLAAIVGAAGEPVLAVRLHAAAAAALARLDMPIQVALRDRHNSSIAALREALGPSFDEAWQTGSALLPADVPALVSPLTAATVR
jgi:predicted ATPase